MILGILNGFHGFQKGLTVFLWVLNVLRVLRYFRGYNFCLVEIIKVKDFEARFEYENLDQSRI